MAFKMKHKLTSVGLKQKSTTPLLNIDPTDKDINKQKELSNYNEINRSVTTRRGMQNNMPGTFTDTNITERADFDTEIPVAKGGEQTTNVPEYIENLKKRFPGVPGSVLIEEGYIGPEFQDEFPLDYDQRDRLETTFAPDPALEEVNNYVGFVSGMGTASDTIPMSCALSCIIVESKFISTRECPIHKHKIICVVMYLMYITFFNNSACNRIVSHSWPSSTSIIVLVVVR